MKSSRRDFLKSLAALGVASSQAVKLEKAFGAEKDVLTIGRADANERLSALRAKTGLRIGSIESFTRGSNLSFVRIRTDDGSEGVGQISTYDADISAMILHRKIARHALGEDPADLDFIVDRCIEANYKYPWSYVCRALSGLDLQ